MSYNHPSRRSVLQSALAATVFLPVKSFAQTTAIGNWQVTSVSDGNLQLPASFILDPLADEQEAEVRDRHSLGEAITPPCNITLLQSEERTVLVDAGAGLEFQASAGLLLDSLDALGIAPDDITDVIFTHAHPDHIWGLLDDFDDLAFWNASYQIGRREWAYWTDPNTVDTIGDARQSFAVGAGRRLARIADQITFFDDGEEILPGIAARATFGHTPGHMAFEVRSGTDAIMILGDCIGNDHMAMSHPGWRSGSDQDQDLAAETRVTLLDQLVSDNMQVLGFHLPQGGLGRIVKSGDAYAFLPSER